MHLDGTREYNISELLLSSHVVESGLIEEIGHNFVQNHSFNI